MNVFGIFQRLSMQFVTPDWQPTKPFATPNDILGRRKRPASCLCGIDQHDIAFNFGVPLLADKLKLG